MLWDYLISRETVAFLATQLRDITRPEAVRATAAESLGKARTPRPVRKLAIAALVQSLDDPIPLVRFFSVRSLGWLHARSALKALKILAEDKILCDFQPDGGTIAGEVKEAINLILSSKGR